MSFIERMILACSLVVVTGDAGAVVLDFESLEHVDALATPHGFEYAEDGFVLETFDFFGFASFGTESPFFSGSTALFNDTPGGLTILSHAAGLPFSLSAIDLTELDTDMGASVTFVGFTALGMAVFETFTLDGNAFQPETFSFSPGFSNLTAVSWTQGAPFHQFDNIVVEAVPEPASLALVGLGLVALGLYRRKRSPTGA